MGTPWEPVADVTTTSFLGVAIFAEFRFTGFGMELS